jgi:amyloid beta A4 precursor protein-binding family A member 2
MSHSTELISSVPQTPLSSPFHNNLVVVSENDDSIPYDPPNESIQMYSNPAKMSPTYLRCKTLQRTGSAISATDGSGHLRDDEIGVLSDSLLEGVDFDSADEFVDDDEGMLEDATTTMLSSENSLLSFTNPADTFTYPSEEEHETTCGLLQSQLLSDIENDILDLRRTMAETRESTLLSYNELVGENEDISESVNSQHESVSHSSMRDDSVRRSSVSRRYFFKRDSRSTEMVHRCVQTEDILLSSLFQHSISPNTFVETNPQNVCIPENCEYEYELRRGRPSLPTWPRPSQSLFFENCYDKEEPLRASTASLHHWSGRRNSTKVYSSFRSRLSALWQRLRSKRFLRKNSNIPSNNINWDATHYHSENDLRSISKNTHHRRERVKSQGAADHFLNQIQTIPPHGKNISIRHPHQHESFLDGTVYRVLYLGSTQVSSSPQSSPARRLHQAQEAVYRIKPPDCEETPSSPVDLVIASSTIVILSADTHNFIMDYSLNDISYIADIGDAIALIIKRSASSSNETCTEAGRSSTVETLTDGKLQVGFGDQLENFKLGRFSSNQKLICHVFRSEVAQYIAQAIGKAFQSAYIEFLRANGVEDMDFYQENDYQDILKQQEASVSDLQLFADKNMEKQIVVSKLPGEQLGIVVMESGWGSMVPTVMVAHLNPNGPLGRCGQLSIGHQIISINKISLVGLTLSASQQIMKDCRSERSVRLSIISSSPVVDVYIRRPDLKYQLGFSVQNGVICSLLRGGIAERGGVRVGHRIIEINNQSVVATPHERIVYMLATALGEIHLRTMPNTIFRLLTGLDTPHYI